MSTNLMITEVVPTTKREMFSPTGAPATVRRFFLDDLLDEGFMEYLDLGSNGSFDPVHTLTHLQEWWAEYETEMTQDQYDYLCDELTKMSQLVCPNVELDQSAMYFYFIG